MTQNDNLVSYDLVAKCITKLAEFRMIIGRQALKNFGNSCCISKGRIQPLPPSHKPVISYFYFSRLYELFLL